MIASAYARNSARCIWFSSTVGLRATTIAGSDPQLPLLGIQEAGSAVLGSGLMPHSVISARIEFDGARGDGVLSESLVLSDVSSPVELGVTTIVSSDPRLSRIKGRGSSILGSGIIPPTGVSVISTRVEFHGTRRGGVESVHTG